MIPPTFATPPLPPEKAFDDTQRSIKSSISGNPPSFPPPNIGQKVALVAPKKLYQLKFALKNIRKMVRFKRFLFEIFKNNRSPCVSSIHQSSRERTNLPN